MTLDLMQKLSPHFLLGEAIRSGKASALGLNNTPPESLLPNARRLFVLVEKVRALPLLGAMPWISASDHATRARLIKGQRAFVTMHSIYRAPLVNAAVGGSKNSAHMDFRAIDFDPPPFITHDELQHAIAADPLLEFDIIAEEGTVKPESAGGSRWLHMQVARDKALPRRRVEDWTVDKLGGTITRVTSG